MSQDPWSRWLLSVRHAGDAGHQRVVRAMAERIRDRVLDAAGLGPGMTVADLGAGEGLMAFGAMERAGPTLRAVLVDISAPLLAHAEAEARALGLAGRCAFVQASAERLEGLADGSVDVVVARAALAYVADKAAAFAECHRVLRPGGRLSIAEPIFRDQALEAVALTRTVAAADDAPGGEFTRLLQRWKAAQFPSTGEALQASAIAGFDERDLVRLAGRAGFSPVHLELHVDVRPSTVRRWDVFLGTSPHPLAPPLAEILAERFSEDERGLFEQVLRPLVEAGTLVESDAIAYLSAQKPGG